jgi:hypothetical protein
MRFGIWNFRSLFRAGSLIAATRELAIYTLHLVGVEKVRLDKEGSVREVDYNIFSTEKDTKIKNLEQDFFLYATEQY